MAKATLMFVAAIVTALMLAQPVSAAGLTSTVTDPVGDATYDKCCGHFYFDGTPAPYQDIVQVSISLRDGRFIFVTNVAAPIPSEPTLPPKAKLLEWSFRLDTDPTTFPSGFPFPKGNTRPAEFMVFIVWDGTSFTGILIDRTPTLTGGETLIIPILFDIREEEITASVDASLMGSPGSFQWWAAAQVWTKELGTEGGLYGVDLAPDTGWAPWPE